MRFNKFFLGVLFFNATAHSTVNLYMEGHNYGFFAELFLVVKNLIHYHEDDITSAHINWSSKFLYKDHPTENGWNLYFHPIKLKNYEKNPSKSIEVQETNIHEVHSFSCTNVWIYYEKYLPYRIYIHNIINTYITIKEHILKTVDDFFETYLKNKLLIGVHIRYSRLHDAELPEKKFIPLNSYINEIQNLINLNPNKPIAIYIASDCHSVIKILEKHFNDKIFYINTFRVEDEKKDPPTEHPGYIGGLGALIDCLLLAKCHYLIHTSSNLASCVCLFNPFIKSIFLPKNVINQSCYAKNRHASKNPFLHP